MSFGRLPNTPQLPQAELPLAYSVQAPWGGLHVTETAHVEYGLIPLASVIEGGQVDRPKTSSAEPRIDLFLSGSDEIQPVPATRELVVSLKDKSENPVRGIATAPYAGGLAIATSFNITKQDLVNNLNENARMVQLNPATGELELVEIDEKNQIAAKEHTQRKASFDYTHFVRTMVETVVQGSIQTAEATTLQLDISRIPFYGIRNLTMTGVGLYYLNNMIDAFSAVAADVAKPFEGAGFVLTSLFLARRTMRKAGAAARDLYNLPLTSAERAEAVSDTVHELYCPNHFDEQLQANLGGEAQ